jgi:hypothetical protein
MRYQHRPAAGFVGLVAVCVTAILAAGEGLGQTREAGKVLVKVGEYAPDFNLPRLTITQDPNGKPIGIVRDEDTVRLSAFRGKRPVCLIMSSYT